MPGASPRRWFGCQSDQCGSKVGDEGDRVKGLRIAEDVDLLAGGHLGDEALAERRPVDVRSEEVRCPGGDHADPARLVGLDQVEVHAGANGTLLGACPQRQGLGQVPVDGPVAVEVLHHDQQ